jgi:hypothetical protein
MTARHAAVPPVTARDHTRSRERCRSLHGPRAEAAVVQSSAEQEIPMSLNLADPVYVRQSALAAYPSQLRQYPGAAGRVVHVSDDGLADVNWPDLGCSSTFRVDELCNEPDGGSGVSPVPQCRD